MDTFQPRFFTNPPTGLDVPVRGDRALDTNNRITVFIGNTDGFVREEHLVSGTPVNAVAATGKITIAVGQPGDADFVTVNGQKYIFKSSLTAPAVANEVLIGTDNSDTANNLKLAITAGTGAGTKYGTGTVANAYVTATVSTNVVTVTASIKGTVGNAYTLVKSGANITLAAATMGTGAGCTLGVDGTTGKQWDSYINSSYRYYAIADNTTADTNWRRVSLGSAY